MNARDPATQTAARTHESLQGRPVAPRQEASATAGVIESRREVKFFRPEGASVRPARANGPGIKPSRTQEAQRAGNSPAFRATSNWIREVRSVEMNCRPVGPQIFQQLSQGRWPWLYERMALWAEIQGPPTNDCTRGAIADLTVRIITFFINPTSC